jgi:hypothetical protein
MTGPPIACTLGAADLEARIREMRALGADGLLDVVERAGCAVLRFRPDPAIRSRVEAVAAAESECCAFLDFRLEHAPDAIALTISAPNGGAEVVGELVAAFEGR